MSFHRQGRSWGFLKPFLPVLALLLALPGMATAQTASLSGRVLSAGGVPIDGATVTAKRGETAVATATTGADGAYSIPSIPAGTYTLSAKKVGYGEVTVADVAISGATTRDFTVSQVAQLNTVVTTASRAEEKILEAPVSISVVSTQQIESRPSLTIADHLRAQPGVDVSKGGLVQSNIVARGFNNAFSGAMLVLQDNRFAGVPSLRVNVPALFPAVNEDIERIEVLLGPAAALYGPNSSSGVMHIITKSPFESQGGTLTFDGGERGVLRGAARYSTLLGDKLAFKVSGEMLRGNDWEYKDPGEPDRVPRPRGTAGQRDTVANVRDFDVAKGSAEARVDFRPRPGIEWINTAGFTNAGSFIELTGANGAAQVKNWTYQTYQSRLRWNRTFAQVFFNNSNAGNDDSLDTDGTFLLRTGNPIVDKSRVWSAQLQHAIDLGTRQSFILGGDYIFTNPQTGGTINGRNEDIDDVTEVGGYVHSVTRITPKLDFVGALRYDTHSEMEESFLSPRAALVFKPSATQNLRLTYNRAFSTPANFSFFLDLPQGRIPIPGTAGYGIRALGVPQGGFTYARTSGASNQLYMRSIFPVLAANPTAAPQFLPNSRVDANAALFYRTLVAGNQATFINALMAAGVTPQNAPAVFGALLGAAAPANVGTVLRLFNPSGNRTNPTGPGGVFGTIVTPASLTDVERLKASFNNTIELGYKGILGEKFRLSVDVWREERENFITPAANVSPNAFIDPATLAAHIAGVLTAQAQAGRVAPQAIPALTTAFATAIASAPVGTVLPDVGGVDPANGLTNSADLIFTYRNVDQKINLWGSDMALDYLLTDKVTLIGTYSYVSDGVFPDIPAGVDSLRLNAPRHKGSFTTRYHDEVRGLTGELRGRYTDAFKVNSGVYVGAVPVNALIDANVAYRLRVMGRQAMIGVSGTNLLNEEVPTFVGVPAVGRMLMTRLQLNF
jgi:iron complex outermembrane receptor protein